MLVISQNQLGKYWLEVIPGDNIKTCDQFYNYVEGRWMTGSFFTSEKKKHNGKVPYRRPVHTLAYLVVIPGLFVKVWRRKISILWKKG